VGMTLAPEMMYGGARALITRTRINQNYPQAGNFSLHHHAQNGSSAHPASYPLMGTRGSFPGGKAEGA
jgi:hypothetical protein